MATIKAEMTAELKEKYAREVAQKIADGGRLLVSITHTSASNMSYRYKVDLVFSKNGQVEIEHLSYWLAACWKETIYAGAFNELKGSGIGTDRYFFSRL